MRNETDGKITPAMTRRLILLRLVEHLALCGHIDLRVFLDDSMKALLWDKKSPPEDLSHSDILRQIRHQQRKLPELNHAAVLRSYPQLNRLGDQLTLTHIQRLVLLVLVWLQDDPIWREATSGIRDLSRNEVRELLAQCLIVKPSKVRDALAAQGRLVKSGLISISNLRYDDLQQHFRILEGLDEQALLKKRYWDDLVRSLFVESFRGKLTVQDFRHMTDTVEIALRLLTSSMREGLSGIHILLYGPPGTGKTELAWALARQAAAGIRTIGSQKSTGDEVEGIIRFRWLLLGQDLFRGSDSTVFIFDELEDLFPSHPGIFFHSSSAFHKGWLNEQFEQTPIPTIWTANDIDWMDRSHLRRFTLVLEVPAPPRSIRRELLTQTLSDYGVSDAWVRHIADSEAVTPAETAALGKIAHSCYNKGNEVETMLEKVFSEKCRASGIQPPRPFRQSSSRINYALEYLNLNVDPEQIIKGLHNTEDANILFSGPPGTGKSALAVYLAQHLDRPLVSRRASDILNPYVGITEKNMSEMFRTAERERAIIFLDEVDSFLRSRELANHTWDVTEVNEMLVQMEYFDGVFIAATNHINNLDPASYRRFDLKIDFRHLDSEQKRRLFCKLVVDTNEAEDLVEYYASCVSKIDELSIGDFRTALRKLEITGQPPSSDNLYKQLKTESVFKLGAQKRRIGFIADTY